MANPGSRLLDLGGPTIGIGNVPMQVNVDPKLDVSRQRCINSLPHDQVFGHQLGENCVNLDINPGDVIVGEVPEENPHINRFEGHFGRPPSGFAAFNGLPLPGANTGDITQQEIERRLRILGISVGTYRFGVGKATPPNGITVWKAGSVGIRNAGIDTFMPGDPVDISYPPIDQAEREKHLAALPHIAGQERSRVAVTVRRRRFGDVKHVIHDALTESIANPAIAAAGLNAACLFDLHDPMAPMRKLKDSEKLGFTAQQQALVAGYSTVTALLELGIIKIANPAWIAGDKPNYALLAADVERNKLANMKGAAAIARAEGRTTVDLAGAVTHVPRKQLDQPQRTLHRNERLLLAATTGVIVDLSTNNHYTPAVSAAVRRAVAVRTFNGAMLERELADEGSFKHVLPDDVSNAKMRQETGITSEHNMRNPLGQILRQQSRIGTDLYVCASYLRLKVEQKALGIALESSRPADKLQILLKH